MDEWETRRRLIDPALEAAAVGIRFLDRLIIGDAAPFSFKYNGLL
jgi:DNA repair protein RadC